VRRISQLLVSTELRDQVATQVAKSARTRAGAVFAAVRYRT
jgi:hypothetical protein